MSLSEATTRLEDMCELVIDCPHFTPDWTNSGHIVLRNQNIRDGRLDLSAPSFTHKEDFDRRNRRAKPTGGDIVFTREAPMGEVCLIPEGLECCLGQRQVLLRPKREISGCYLFYALQSPNVRHQIFWNEGTGSTVSNVRIPVLKDLRIPRNDSEEAIAATLGALDDKIELNRKMNATLEAMVRALFRDWFVDFGPTQAKMEGRPPYLSADLWPLFPARLDAEGKPDGWEVSTIGDEVRVVGGSTPSTKEPDFWDGGINWATPKDLSTLAAPVLLETSRSITAAGLAKISSGLLPVGSLLLSSRAPIGYLAIAEVPVAINQGFIGMICDKRVSNAFAWLWTRENMEAILAKANGSTFQEISKGNFRPLSVVVPSDPVLRTFDAIAKPLYERIAKNERESRTLAQTRDLLLPRLMSGELRVTEAEQLVAITA